MPRTLIHLCLISLLAIAVCFPLTARSTVEEETLQKQSVTDLSEKDGEVANAKEAVVSTLSAVGPQEMKSPRTISTPDGRRLLLGDLFQNHQICALVELPFQDEETGIGVGFAIWNGKSWEPRNLFKIAPVWRPEGWKKADDEYMPITPATSPFWMMKVTPDKPPLAVLVGAVWKYWQEHYLAKYDSASRKLILISEDKDPTPVDGYLRLYGNSGHRATFEDWTFCRWTGEKLIPKGYWYDGVDESEVISEYRARSYDDQGRKIAEYLITQEGDERNQVTYSITSGTGKIFANVRVAPNKNSDANAINTAAAAYLFERLTGLPRSL